MATTASTTGEQAYQARRTITAGYKPGEVIRDGGEGGTSGVGGGGGDGQATRPNATTEQQRRKQEDVRSLQDP